MSICSQHPSLRFIFPMIGGIVCGDYFYTSEWAGFSLPIFVVLFSGLLLAHYRHQAFCFGLGTWGLFFVFGYALTARQLDRILVALPLEKSCYQIRLIDKPVEKRKTFRYQAILEGWWTPKEEWCPVDGCPEVVCYLAKDSLMSPPVRGARLWVYAFMKPLDSLDTSATFQYGRYLRHHGISGTAYVSAHQWKQLEVVDLLTLRQRAQDAQSSVVALYQRLGFHGDELSVLSALTIGEREGVDATLRTTYSISGASHVLALSGLHVGFIYGFLFFFSSFLWKRWACLKYPLCIGMIFLLWLFAYFTGLSVSVVRAVVMCTFSILLSFRHSAVQSFDTLLIAAFCLLVYQPLWLFDVGFQLSFAAVAAILWIYPILTSHLASQTFWVRKIGSLLAVSLAAQCGTAPLVLYYFSYFPTHFLLTNLWVLPCVSLVMYAAAFLLLLTPFPTWQGLFSPVIIGLIQVQHQGLRWIEHLPYASAGPFHPDIWTIGWMYLVLYACFQCFSSPRIARVYFLLIILLIGSLWAFFAEFSDKL